VPADRFLSPAEVCERLDVTVRALRLYERRGLLAPLRTSAGWRTYGPDQIVRLHQILALKRLGLSLARVSEVLKGRLAELDNVLELQQAALRARKAEAERGLELLAEARRRIAAGQSLSLDDLTKLTRETTMSETLTQDEWREIFEPLLDKHYTFEERAAAQQREQALEAQGDWAPEAAWAELIAEARRLMALGDPGSPEAADLARRWQALVEQFTGGDPTLHAKSAALWRDAMADPATADRVPLTPEMFAFVGEALRRSKAA
jgi:MerR family transcriptional regulator, thiopeptide resistance regulator